MVKMGVWGVWAMFGFTSSHLNYNLLNHGVPLGYNLLFEGYQVSLGIRRFSRWIASRAF